MKKGILISLMFITIVGTAAPTSKSDKILYIFPDDVEIAINDYIERCPALDSVKFILTLYKEKDKIYKVYVNICSVDSGTDELYWEQITNRFAVINNKEYPLLFDYDFSTKEPSKIGEYGKRDGQVLKVMPINDGFYIKFSKFGLCAE